MLSIKIETGNAAFADAGCGIEIARILRSLADDLEDAEQHCKADWTLRDGNGNTVGHAHLQPEGPE